MGKAQILGRPRHAENRDCKSRMLTVGSERVLISGSRSSASTARYFSFQKWETQSDIPSYEAKSRLFLRCDQSSRRQRKNSNSKVTKVSGFRVKVYFHLEKSFCGVPFLHERRRHSGKSSACMSNKCLM